MPQTSTPFSTATDFRLAQKEQLSLALMDARNRTLLIASQFENTEAAHRQALQVLGHGAWFQEWWTARNVQRSAGALADGAAARLASAHSDADMLWERAVAPAPFPVTTGTADAEQTRAYLLNTLEVTLDLLDRAPDTDSGLYFFRLALFHEECLAEELVVMAQSLGLGLAVDLPGPNAQREPLAIPATRWQVGAKGAEGAGFLFDNEQPAFDDPVPEFEIDAQVVSWAQFVEFVDDGGYDTEAFWHPDGWRWLAATAAAEGRRGPRYVDQIGVASGAVMQTRFGKARRMAGGQCVTHVSWFEADAWCRWAGRRLPAEIEWEVAAHLALRRGFRWGDVWEWTASAFRPYPGFQAGPWADYSAPHFGVSRVLRGASFATPPRIRSAKFRKFASPDQDALFVGFRSCAA